MCMKGILKATTGFWNDFVVVFINIVFNITIIIIIMFIFCSLCFLFFFFLMVFPFVVLSDIQAGIDVGDFFLTG